MATDLKDKVAQSLTRYNMLSPGDRVGVGVSGGADSVTLLWLLHNRAEYALTVLHVNHHLRGEESDFDERFVRELAAKLGIPIEVSHATPGPGNMEQNARDLRRGFFFECRRRLDLRCVALGHNQTDQAETVLYRFLRGTGLSGLAGMAPVTLDGLVRPLIDVTREDVREWATTQGLSWREDSSNQDTELVRNRLRLEMINPQLVRVLSGMARVARDEEDWWRGRAEDLFKRLAKRSALGLLLEVVDLADLHAAEQRRLIRRMIQQVKGDLRSIDVQHVDGVSKLLNSQAGHDRILIPGVDILRSFGTMLFSEPGRIGSEPRHFHLFTKFGAEMALPYDNGRLYVNWVKLENQNCANFGMDGHAVFEVDDLDGEVLERVGHLDLLQVRNWEPGDEYCRAGHKKSEKIKSLFQEDRILLWERRRWPVLVLNEQIVWSRRFGVAAQFQATDASRNIVRILYTASSGSVPV